MSLESAKEKLAQRFEGDIDERLREIYVAPYGGLRPQVPEGERFLLLNRIVNIFTESDTRSLLILGDSGAGKTSLCLHLCKRLWEVYREDGAAPASSTHHLPKPLPIYIHLAQYKNQLKEGLIEQVLEEALLSAKEIRHLKTQPLLLLLDGFDEVDIQENLYQTQRWGQPGYHICMVITCRSEALTHKNKQALFEASRGQGKERHYETLHLQSFTDEQIHVYLERYIQQNSKDAPASSLFITSAETSPFAAPSSSSETPAFIRASSSEVPSSSFLSVNDYLTWFERLPSLKELIKTPFLLTVAVRALPKIIAPLKITSSESAVVPENSSILTRPPVSKPSSFIQQKHLTQSGLFKAFLNNWFFRQAQRVKAQGLLAMLSEKEIQGYMEAYAKNLAASLIEPEGQLNDKTLSEKECLRPEFIEPYQNEKLLEKYHDLDPEQNQSKYFFEEPHPGIKTQTELQKSHLRAILSGCMLRSVGNQFRFIHKSIAEYLAAQELMDGLLGNYDHYVETLSGAQNLNRVLLTKEPQLLSRLAEASLEEERFKELLERIIVATKTQDGLSVAAANAISILNRAGVSFYRRDFSQIQIPGADLSETLCARTHFQGANLKDVNFQKAYLAHAHFEGANLEGVKFGEAAYWKMPSIVHVLVHHASSPGVSEWLVGCENGYAYRLNDRGKQLKSYRHKPYQLLGKNEVSVNALAVYPGSKPRLATGGSNHLIWVWELEGTALYRLEGHMGPITALAFHSDGRLASGSWDETIRLWELDGTPGPVLHGHINRVTSLALCPNGRLASGSVDKTIRLWEPDGTPGPVLRGHTSWVTSLLLCPDGWLASGSVDKTIRLWEPDGMPGPVLRGHINTVTSLALRPNGRLASGSEDKTIRLWEPHGMPGPVLPAHTSTVTSLALLPDGRLASGSEDKTIRLWEPDGTLGSVLRGHTGTVTSLAFCHDRRLASGSEDKTIRLWEPDATLDPVLLGHTRTVTSLAFHPDGRLASGSEDKTIRLWEPDGTLSSVLRGHTGTVTSLAFRSDGCLVSGSEDKTIRLWEPDGTPALMIHGDTDWATRKLPGFQTCFSSPSSFWREEPDDTPEPLPCGHWDWVISLALLPDGRLASGSKDHTIRLWEPHGTPGPVLYWHTHWVTSLILLPDGRLLSGSKDKTLSLWSPTEARLLQTFSVDFSVSVLLRGQELLYAAGDNASVLAFTIDAAHRFHVQWVRTGAPQLILTNAQLQGTLNLSKDNHALLKQQGAEGKPQRTSRPYLPWCHLFQPITGTAHVEPQKPLVSTAGAGTSPHLISDNAWIVSIARKKEGSFSFRSLFGTSGSDHAFLIIEGIQQRRRFIIRAELTYDTQTKQVHITMNPLDDLARFDTFVARGIEANQFLINASVGERLLRHIQADQQKVIHYNFFGDGGKDYPSLLSNATIPSPSSSPSSASSLSPSPPPSTTTTKETHNCLSWCRKQVMQIGQEMPTRWYNFAITLPSNVTAPKSEVASSSRLPLPPSSRS